VAGNLTCRFKNPCGGSPNKFDPAYYYKNKSRAIANETISATAVL